MATIASTVAASQVITENSECFRAAGNMLEEKRRSLFWTSSATDCIDQILVDFMEIEIVKECTVKGQIITRYIHNSFWLLDLMKNELTEGKDLIEPSTSNAATTSSHCEAWRSIELLLRNYSSQTNGACLKCANQVYAKRLKGLSLTLHSGRRCFT